MKIIGACNLKGGVGKTSLVTNIAALTDKKHKVVDQYKALFKEMQAQGVV